MLEEAVLSLKAGITAPVADRWSPQIIIGTALLIPEDYVADLTVRLALYRRLAEIEDEREIEGFAAELVDRFGKLPQEVEHLLRVVAIKSLSRRANVEKVEAGPKGIVLSFRDNIFADPEGLIAFIREQGSAVRMRNDPKNTNGQQLVFFEDWPRPQDRLKGTAAVLRKLVSILRSRPKRREPRLLVCRLLLAAGFGFRFHLRQLVVDLRHCRRRRGDLGPGSGGSRPAAILSCVSRVSLVSACWETDIGLQASVRRSICFSAVQASNPRMSCAAAGDSRATSSAPTQGSAAVER
jgi:hypothetical protein